MERLDSGPVICAEGYLFELERRGYVQAGPFVPEVVLDAPEVVKQLSREFVRAGSDVVEAFTYYGHREKMKIVGKEDLLEPLNRQAIRIAQEVAEEAAEQGGGERPLVAGDVCNTNVFIPGDPSSAAEARAMFEEQIGWAVEEGVDFIVAETISFTDEALLALEVIKAHGLPAVITLAIHREPEMRDGDSVEVAAKRLEDAGADVVGLNCHRGPATLMPLVRSIRAAVSCHVAALPVPYRTSEAEPTFQALRDPACHCIPNDRPFPVALDPFTCNRYEMAEFARDAYAENIHYLGICCGNGPHHTREMAEALGRHPAASRYSVDMSRHFIFGSDAKLREHNKAYLETT
jgi:betaine-homocysteine S-methyltransferase